LEFWRWIGSHERELREAFLSAVARKDFPAMKAVVERIAEPLARVSPRLTALLNGGADTSVRLAIRGPDAEAQAVAVQVLAHAPKLTGWSFCEAIPSPAKRISTRDTQGNELTVEWGEVGFWLLPPKPDGSISLLLALPREFDPKGELGHLYRAVTDEILKHTLGGVPARMGSYAMVPASMLAGRPIRPLDELARAWSDATGSGPRTQ
jgi:hypothetical protein